LRREARQREQQKKIEEASLELQLFGTPADNLNYLLFDEAIDNLPDQQKTAFLLSRHNRLTYVQIADRMGISHETVKTYLKRATNAITNYINNRTTLLVGLIIIKYFVILFKLMTPFFS
jgi:RNA polymerase sigma-70 factor (ECF subfamily)